MDEWHDINSPGGLPGTRKGRKAKETVVVLDTSFENQKPKQENEVRLLSAQWKPGPDGFACSEKCLLEVKAEFLKETLLCKIRGKLFGVYDGEEVDLAQEVTGYLDKDSGIAPVEIKKLWFINDAHYSAWRKDRSTPCKYIVKEISGGCHQRSKAGAVEAVYRGPDGIACFHSHGRQYA